MADQVFALNFPPGVQRDGTRVDSDTCLDALWTRFRLARARKMGGFHLASSALVGAPRAIHMFYSGDRVYVHIGTSHSLEQVVLDRFGNFISYANRTPKTFVGGPDPGWTLDTVFDTTSEVVQLVAHSVPNMSVIAGNIKTAPFLGQVDAVAPLAEFAPPLDTGGGAYTPPKVAGGIVSVQPYVFDYDTAGFVGWGAPNLPNNLGVKGGNTGAGNARISGQKVVAGRPLRGGGANSPAAAFWTLSEMVTASFIGGTPVFNFSTVDAETSILSEKSVVQYDTLFFWAGVDRFLVYNGTVVEVPNKFNQDWFFDNINRQYAGRAFAMKMPRYGEIWFCAPLFGNTECSHAAIYNVREQCWYDTELPNGVRTAGYFAQGLQYPVMGGLRGATGGYRLWLHEKGTDQTGDGAPKPVRAFFETPFIGGASGDHPDDHALTNQMLEADIVQKGDMSVWIAGGANPRAGDTISDKTILKALPKVTEQILGFQGERRLSRLHFESNTLGGTFLTGRSLLHAKPGDAKLEGSPGNPLTAG